MDFLKDTVAVILAGGEGTRLKPLTNDRAKPAVPFGGKYRIVDFTLTNCLHSGIHRVLVLTQYKSHSLHKHLRDGWSIFNPELGQYVTAVPAQMRTGGHWYHGTADAIYQNLFLLERSGARRVLLLSGDHIYRMDYAALLGFHNEREAEVTVASMELAVDDARSFGVMEVDDDQRITGFHEKPIRPRALPDDPAHALVSMGIYAFDLDMLLEILHDDHARADSGHDFGSDIFPRLIADRRVYAYPFGSAEGRVTPDRYWRDVGTLDAYYQANMDLLEPVPPLDLYQEDWPIRTYQPQTPPARTVSGFSGNEGIFINSVLAGGAVIAGGSVQHSILFPHVYVGDEALVENSIVFDDVSVGNGARLRNCIVDKHVVVPPGENIGYDAELDRSRFAISEQGVVVVPRGYRFGVKS